MIMKMLGFIMESLLTVTRLVTTLASFIFSKIPLQKKRTKKESDWKSYYGSNEHLKQELNEEESHQTVRRTILRLCRTKGECSYYEIKEQLAVDALLKEEYYNNFVGCKIHRKHLP
jgi:hypothetical protein